MSAREMERCECQVGHAGPLMVLVDARCSAGCGELRGGVWCECCGKAHVMPYVAVAGCFRETMYHTICDGQALLALEPLDAAVGVGP